MKYIYKNNHRGESSLIVEWDDNTKILIASDNKKSTHIIENCLSFDQAVNRLAILLKLIN